ncbi:hypothetical protein Vafri_2865 [Volvox africanus]|nr:hypothetical protein Vafri_2865 [Volvox africanus]
MTSLQLRYKSMYLYPHQPSRRFVKKLASSNAPACTPAKKSKSWKAVRDGVMPGRRSTSHSRSPPGLTVLPGGDTSAPPPGGSNNVTKSTITWPTNPVAYADRPTASVASYNARCGTEDWGKVVPTAR